MKAKRAFLCILTAGALVLSGCSSAGSKEESSPGDVMEEDDAEEKDQPAKIDMNRWQYNEDADVYWQTGILYCSDPADESYENLGIYVPGSYMSGKENEDGTYTCETDLSGTAGGFTAETAPIVIPVDTPGYAAMNAPSGYVSSVSSYTDAGLIYVYAGCRGRDAGAPAGVTDLKAAIRYIRYNEDLVPGSMERVFSFGMSGGGAQSAVLGASGDSELYEPYLEAIGAASGVSDAVTGSMCWCPVTNLDLASEAYEWNLGCTRTGLSEDMQELSDSMAEQFALYINELGLQDEAGNTLLLAPSEEGIYQSGSYYDYLKQTVETSLNHFLEDTTFPYTAESFGGRGGFPGPDGEQGGEAEGAKGGFPGPDGEQGGEAGGANGGFPGPDGEQGGEAGGAKGGFPGPDGDFGGEAGGAKGGFPGPDGDLNGGIDGELPEENAFYERDGIERKETTGGITLSGTYETAEDYINALNAETLWVIYDSTTNTASITSIADFVRALKIASKDLGAFDALDESQGENILFGDGDGEGDHFDAAMAELLKDSAYGEEFEEDMLRTDALGSPVSDRVNMYTPLYYLSSYYDGYQTANAASFWRIRSGINQSDTALTTEVNLALALENYGAEVDFETVWGQAHVEAERTGESTANFIEWVIACCQ